MRSSLLWGGAVALALLSSPAQARHAPRDPRPLRCVDPAAIDGDTIRCGRADNRLSYRLIGIDAPELPGHCRRGRICVPGNPFAAMRALAQTLGNGRVTVQVFGTDRYHRRLAIVRVSRVNLACTQYWSGHAIYKPEWDKQRRTARECQI